MPRDVPTALRSRPLLPAALSVLLVAVLLASAAGVPTVGCALAAAALGALATAGAWRAERAEHVALEQALVGDEHFRRVFEDAPIGMLVTDVDGRVERVNDAYCRLVDHRRAELEGGSSSTTMHPEDQMDLQPQRARLVAGEIDTLDAEARLMRADGRILETRLAASVVRDGEGRARQVIWQVVDVGERKRFEGQLQYLADHDPLTGLFNRRRFEVELDSELATNARYGTGGAVLVVDLDHFKYVNDSLGHSAGDALIAHVSDAFRRRLRQTDVLARLGGDEFAIVLAQVDEEEARMVAETLLQAVRDEGHVGSEDRRRHVSASIGIAMFAGSGGLTGEELLVEADIAMYDAKEAGRDCLVVFDADESRQVRMQARLSWAERIRTALTEERFVLHAQRIATLRGEQEERHELLLRMVGDDGDLIPPGSFLVVAERFGLIEQIDRWVVREAIAMLARTPTDVRFEVNLSARSVCDPALPDLIAGQLHAAGVDPSRLCFEVTETAAIVNVERAKRFADRLSQLGCEFALDDFGAGFASFYYLKHLSFDYLKIDGEFIKDLVHSRTNQLVVRSVVDIARGLGKRTIAEFVGDEATLELLRTYGVDFAQGFHIGLPGPLELDRRAPAARPKPARVDPGG